MTQQSNAKRSVVFSNVTLPLSIDSYGEYLMLGVGASNWNPSSLRSIDISHFLVFTTDQCTLPCMNGATCIGPDQCHCVKGWTGFQCEIPICTIPCYSIGGNCTAPDTCTCNAGWTDALCETRMCHLSLFLFTLTLFDP